MNEFFSLKYYFLTYFLPTKNCLKGFLNWLNHVFKIEKEFLDHLKTTDNKNFFTIYLKQNIFFFKVFVS